MEWHWRMELQASAHAPQRTRASMDFADHALNLLGVLPALLFSPRLLQRVLLVLLYKRRMWQRSRAAILRRTLPEHAPDDLLHHCLLD
jgi:hypothetical protein